MSRLMSAAASESGHKHIFRHGALRQQVVRLKDKAGLLIANFRGLNIAERDQVAAVQQHRTARGAIQRADGLQQRAFARAARPDDGEGFPARDVERDIGEDAHSVATLGDVSQFDQVCGRRHGLVVLEMWVGKQKKHQGISGVFVLVVCLTALYPIPKPRAKHMSWFAPRRNHQPKGTK
jgi:hypothetical protein